MSFLGWIIDIHGVDRLDLHSRLPIDILSQYFLFILNGIQYLLLEKC